MHATQLIAPLLEYGAPLSSGFVALAAALCVPLVLRHVRKNVWRAAAIILGLAALFAAYHLAALDPKAGRWLEAVNSPVFAAYLVLILPAIYLRRTRWHGPFLLLPAAVLVLAAVAVSDAYAATPSGGGGFYWILIPAPWLIAGVVSLLLLAEPLMSLKRFRFTAHVTFFLVLVYGGFAFRQGYQDYQDMLKRRRDRPDIMNLSETSPVMQSDRRMVHLPSAPCRFSADGGYVQGCNMEMFQRLAQVNLSGVARRDVEETGALAVVLGAVTAFLILCLLAGRWFCGWLCPLCSLGTVLDGGRRLLRLPHLKPARPVKLAYLFSGMSLAGIGLAMAKAYPHLDAQGRFAGCKIPVYPFCKVCPSQQMCPVAAHGPANYSGLPTWEWGFGFFRVATIALLALFALSFVAGRRLWCRFCPMGMISGLFNRGGQARLVKDAQKCNRCGTCSDVCPMDIDLVRAEMENPDVGSFDCVLCLKCVEKCPRDGCLGFEYNGVRVAESQFGSDLSGPSNESGRSAAHTSTGQT